MSMIPQAVLFAAEKHKDQLRKGTDIPYIVHPLGVMEMLIRAGASKDAVVAGILHDTLEDTNTTYDELVEKFGKRIADIVKFCSEPDKSLPWEDRKLATFKKVRKCKDADCLTVFFADKIHNIQSIHRDLIETNYDIWSRFNRGQESQMWYYGRICQIAKNISRTANDALRTLAYEYWWEHDKLVERINKQYHDNVGLMLAEIDGEDYEPEHEEFTGTTPWERAQGLKEMIEKQKTPLEQYHELSLRLSDITEQEADISERIDKAKSRFTKRDWDKLIKSSPIFMRPMINEQKKKYLKQH
ncbi:MAG: bifunctional (p)ppGpp synthetase/guanosine-3',5'-bis(diphosphate) 3'-pyrophosphohydrolase [Alphaproteobacteria bacterium]|nr:bifunctional (p)ppGpp synthetase/guanosine-3',5'-bis(diphosphate) 3'-pyrophosphohydrolase [Alphaproteobacteria bacterium]